MTYQDVMETYRHPISVRYIPRIFGWLAVFIILVGVHSTAYAMNKNLLSGFKYHNGQMTGQYVQ